MSDPLDSHPAFTLDGPRPFLRALAGEMGAVRIEHRELSDEKGLAITCQSCGREFLRSDPLRFCPDCR